MKCYLREARAAEEWLEGEREHLARLAVEGLSALVAFHLGQQDYAAGIRFAERLLALDPLNEAAHRWMMRLLQEREDAIVSIFSSYFHPIVLSWFSKL